MGSEEVGDEIRGGVRRELEKGWRGGSGRGFGAMQGPGALLGLGGGSVSVGLGCTKVYSP